MNKAYVIVNKTYDGDTEVIQVCLDKERAKAVCASKNSGLPEGNRGYESFEIIETLLDNLQFCHDACCNDVLRNAINQVKGED
jgi:hypothetical protein